MSASGRRIAFQGCVGCQFFSNHVGPRSLEELYLELRELAKQQDLEIEYRLSREKPE